MRSEVEAIAEQMVELGRGYDPARFTGDDAEAIADAARVIVRAAGSIEARSAARAADANAWRRAGCRSAEEWLARKSGSSKARAKKTLELGGQLERHENLRDRYTSGRVSQDQAEIVGGAADENPQAEASLLDAAETETLNTLRQEAAKAKAAVSDEEARQAKIHQERFGSAGHDEDGAYRLGARMSAFQGGIFDTIWGGFRDLVHRQAKKQGLKLTARQIGADALVLMAQTAAENRDPDRPGSGLALPDVRLHLLIDHDAWQRGRTEQGETCEIDGVGPVTVSQAKELTQQGAFVTASTTDGHDVHRVAHLGTCDPASLTAEKVHEVLDDRGVDVQAIDVPGRQHIPAVLDTAVMIRDRTCQHPGCDHRWRLQRDHQTAVALGGRTTYHQLQRLCWNHHDAKTRDDMRKIRDQQRQERTRAGPAP